VRDRLTDADFEFQQGDTVVLLKMPPPAAQSGIYLDDEAHIGSVGVIDRVPPGGSLAVRWSVSGVALGRVADRVGLVLVRTALDVAHVHRDYRPREHDVVKNGRLVAIARWNLTDATRDPGVPAGFPSTGDADG